MLLIILYFNLLFIIILDIVKTFIIVHIKPKIFLFIKNIYISSKVNLFCK